MSYDVEYANVRNQKLFLQKLWIYFSETVHPKNILIVDFISKNYAKLRIEYKSTAELLSDWLKISRSSEFLSYWLSERLVYERKYVRV